MAESKQWLGLSVLEPLLGFAALGPTYPNRLKIVGCACGLPRPTI